MGIFNFIGDKMVNYGNGRLIGNQSPIPHFKIRVGPMIFILIFFSI